MDSHTTGPGFKTQWVRYTFYLASDWLPPHMYQYMYQKVEHLQVCVKGLGRISWSGLTQDIIKVPSGTVVVTFQFLTNDLF